jgi:ubiquitin-like modifier-activating enzyme ATG7
VSYSNPSRQCLFELSDCESKKPKAEAAADALKRILPAINASGIVMTIPMPGHPSSQSTSTTSEHEEVTAAGQLDKLIREHDVCFALTDSREARWLPTLLCAAHDKLLINCALGFDSYLVMRHGHGVESESDVAVNTSSRLGCYFCTDVVAAVNSQKDRTLDQQVRRLPDPLLIIYRCFVDVLVTFW